MNPEEEKGRAAVGRICRNGRFQAWNEESEWVMEYQIIVSMTDWQIMTVYDSTVKCSAYEIGAMDGGTIGEHLLDTRPLAQWMLSVFTPAVHNSEQRCS